MGCIEEKIFDGGKYMSVNSYAESLSSNLVLIESEKQNIRTSISTLRARLNLYFNDIEDIFEFGSYTRGTILPRKADGNSDIDLMIVFKNGDSYKPQTHLNRLKKFAEKYYSSSEIFQSSPTIVLSLNHIKFELVPAYSLTTLWSKAYYIPAPKNIFEEWIQTEPNRFNESLTNKNIRDKNKIKPMIRLAKYWNARQNHVYASYLLEKYIVDKSYGYYTNTTFDYFAEFALSLPTNHLNQNSRMKVASLQSNISEIKDLRAQGYERLAEEKLKKLLPSL